MSVARAQEGKALLNMAGYLIIKTVYYFLMTQIFIFFHKNTQNDIRIQIGRKEKKGIQIVLLRRQNIAFYIFEIFP